MTYRPNKELTKESKEIHAKLNNMVDSYNYNGCKSLHNFEASDLDMFE